MAKVPEKLFVRPAEGRLVRDPISLRPLPAEGDNKPKTSYWLRRIRCGDCTTGPAPKAKKAQDEATPASKPEPKTTSKTKETPKKGDER